MYLLLMVYSLCNLNVVSWGTREVKQTKSEKEDEEAKQIMQVGKSSVWNQLILCLCELSFMSSTRFIDETPLFVGTQEEKRIGKVRGFIGNTECD